MTFDLCPTPLPKLYRACAIVPQLDDHKDVEVNLFRANRPVPVVDPRIGIEGYARLNETFRSYPECALSEYFTQDEIGPVVAWAAEDYSIQVQVSRVRLPIPDNIGGYGCAQDGRLHRRVLFSSPKNRRPFPLFNLHGYYDLRLHDALPDTDDIAL